MSCGDLRHTNKVGGAILIAVCGEGRAVKDLSGKLAGATGTGSRGFAKPSMMAECRGLITRRLKP